MGKSVYDIDTDKYKYFTTIYDTGSDGQTLHQRENAHTQNITKRAILRRIHGPK